jgi:hypothetical protein
LVTATTSVPHAGPASNLARFAEDRKLPLEALKKDGWRDLPGGKIGMPYYDETGMHLFDRVRNAPGRKPRFLQPSGEKTVPYGLHRLADFASSSTLYLAEGETDTQTLWHHNLAALGLPGANNVKALHKEHLAGFETICVCQDADNGGENFVAGLAKHLKEIGFAGVALALTMPPGFKDVSELHVANPDDFRQALDARKAVAQVLLDGPATSAVPGLVTTCLADVKPRPVEWLVPGLIPLGKLTMLAGDGGHGKSSITLDLAACISTGRPCFGLNYQAHKPAEVLLFSCEDDLADTVVPRLLAASADLQKARHCETVRDAAGKLKPFSLADFEAMEAFLASHRDVRAVIIDPAGAYIGRAGVNENKDAELRKLLVPLAELAARFCVAIVLVKHLNKGAGLKAVDRVGGSVGYVNTVRSALLVAPDPDNDTRKLLLPMKGNLTGQARGIAFQLVPLAPEKAETIVKPMTHLKEPERVLLREQLFSVAWGKTVDTTADEAVQAGSKTYRGPNKVERCKAWLRDFLKTHAYPSEEILTAAKAADFTFDNVKEAKAALKAEGLRNSNASRLGGAWWSGFGTVESWCPRPDPDGPDAPLSPCPP